MTLQPETDSDVRTYRRAEVIIVHKTKDAFGGLSNMAPGYPLKVNDVRILTAEALYQACRFPHLPDVQRKIIEQHSPMTAKMKSKSHRGDSRADWDRVRFKVMRWCLRVKLAQHYEEFGRLLLATKQRSIVEFSRKDDYWGAKLADASGDTLIGQNVLGRLLMELRERLKGDVGGALRSVPPLGIDKFLLFGQRIETVTRSVSAKKSSDRQSSFALSHQSSTDAIADFSSRADTPSQVGDVADMRVHFAQLLRPIFPARLEIRPIDLMTDELVFRIHAMYSRKIHIRISRDVLDDYRDDKTYEATMDRSISAHLRVRFEQFVDDGILDPPIDWEVTPEIYLPTPRLPIR
jgi:ribA/ribD-fused uncharacterized protein